MRRALLLLVPAGLLLAACTSSSSASSVTTLPDTGGTGSVKLSADAATCTPAPAPTVPKGSSATPQPQGPTCTIRVHYVNASAAPLSIDAGLTRVVDTAGSTYRPQAPAGTALTSVVIPSGEVSVDWVVQLSAGSTLESVTWIGPTEHHAVGDPEAHAEADPDRHGEAQAQARRDADQDAHVEAATGLVGAARLRLDRLIRTTWWTWIHHVEHSRPATAA